MKYFLFILLFMTSCASAGTAPESETTRQANTEAQFEEDLTMVCETSPDLELKAEDFIALWKEQAQTQKLKALIGDDRESVVWLRDRLDAERGNTCAILAHWDSIFSGGKINSRVISAVLRSGSEKLQACYEKIVEAGDSRRFKVVVAFEIRRDGTTKVVSEEESVSVDGNFIESDAGLAACLGEAIQTLQFPGGGDVMVEKTFIFDTA